jgi:single-stranded-DNA-specific exonuclease
MNSSYIQGNKYVWRMPAIDHKAVADIAASYNLSMPIAHVLFSRGFKDRAMIDAFLFSSFEKDVAHPSLLKDAEKAVARIIKAIDNQEKILVFGDYDVDGITSSAMMMICLLPLGANVNFFLPHRTRDGYGISTKIIERAAQNGYKLIVTVDNGITAIEQAECAKRVGIDLIITDHHRPHDHVPDAFAVVNPNQHDCPYPFKTLAGVGVGFKILTLLYEKKGLEMPAKAYELLLLGTIADVVPLTGENRFWVRYGLSYVNRVESLSFKTLKENGKVIKAAISATDIGFSIAPQINALGRLEDPRQGVKFLIGADKGEVQEVGKILLELNETRKHIERSIYDEIVAQVEQKKIDIATENIIIAASSKWPPGVIGLVASRIVGAYGKPTILLHLTKDGIAKGSCRSIQEFNMFDALASCHDLITQFGGHSQAAGLSLPIDNIEKLKVRLEERIAQMLKPFDLQQKIAIDAQVQLGDLNQKFVHDMNHLEPFGHENRSPSFYVSDVVLIQKPTLLKNAHVKCTIFADGVIKPLIFFNRPEIFEHLMNYGQEPFTVAANVVENHWNGRVNVEMTGIDIAPSIAGDKQQ